MSFVNEILGTASELFEKATQKSTYYAQIAKLNVKITAENSGLKDLYAQLGQAYFESSDGESAADLRELCEKIVEVRGKIEGYQAEIEELKAAEAAAAEAKAEKKAAAEAAKAAAAAAEDEIEITIEVVPEPTAEEIAQEVEAIGAEVETAEPPVATLYVDESAESENKE